MNSTTPLDLHWCGHRQSIAAALLRSEKYSALLDPGPSSTIPVLQQSLAQQGLSFSDLHAIFLTHIHLDHAGATGTLVRKNPRLRVYVHSRGVPHLLDPEKLLNSAARLYGDDMSRLFGEFLPVPSSNLQPLEGGEALSFGSRRLEVLYTPGHAHHHVTYLDPFDGTAFVGDTVGLSINGHPFILPATPPPDISIELWDASLDAIAALHPKRLFLTHFSYSPNPERHIASYRDRLHQWRDLSADILTRNLDESASIQRFSQVIAAEAAQTLSPDEMSEYLFTGALHLSWLGLARYHRKKETVPAPAA